MLEVDCQCGMSFEVEEGSTGWSCPRCGLRIVPLESGDVPSEDSVLESSAVRDTAMGDAALTESELEGRDHGDALTDAGGAEAEAVAAGMAEDGLPLEAGMASFFAAIGASFAYPLQNGGVGLAVGVPFVYCLWISARMIFMSSPAFPVFLLIALFLVAYFFLFLRAITEASACGHSSLPDWPGASDLEVFAPLRDLAVVLFCCWLPFQGTLWVLTVWAPQVFADVTGNLLLVGMAAFAVGLAPVVYLAVVLWNAWRALDVVLLARGILASPVAYLLCAGVSACLLGVAAGSTAVVLLLEDAIGFFHSFLVLPLLGAALHLYLAMVFARLVGTYYFTCRHELDWFEQK